jgi:hypothetical protein
VIFRTCIASASVSRETIRDAGKDMMDADSAITDLEAFRDGNHL